MDMKKMSEGTCPVGRGLARTGDTWSMLILRDAALGLTRFDEFQRSLGIAPNILTRRLAALVRDGVLERRRYNERPPRDEYVLTQCGRDYLPILSALGAWGARYFGEGGVSQLVEAGSGRPIDPVVVDRATGRPLDEIDLRTVLPGGAG
jgi:DNA-binding HxlR family transcriptional regulator